MSERPGAVEPGTVIAGYRVERLLATGGMGEVYLATQLSVDRPVALKILPPAITRDPEIVTAFLHEARVLATLDHPSIISAFDAGKDQELYYLAMAYFKGTDLATQTEYEGTFPEKWAMTIALKVAKALAYAWGKFEMLHLDIKPANIMFNAEQEVRVLDMGLARKIYQDTGLTVASYYAGTPYYSSPEQLLGEPDIDYRADIFSLGATLYYMLTGVQPYQEHDPETLLSKHLLPAPPKVRTLNPNISQACSELIARMMDHERIRRPAKWAELIASIEQVLTGITQRSTGRVPVPPAERAKQVQAKSTGRIQVHKTKRPTPTRATPSLAQRRLGKPKKKSFPTVLVSMSVVAFIIGGFLLLRSEPSPKEKTVRTPSPPAVVPATPDDTGESVAARIAEVRRYREEHPDELDEALRKYETLRAEIQEEPFVSELNEALASLKEKVRERDEAKAAEEARRRAEAQEEARQQAGARLYDQLSAHLLALQLREAIGLLDGATGDEGLQHMAEELAETTVLVKQAAAVPRLVLEGFKRDIGREISIELKSGATVLYVSAVGEKGITAGKAIKRDGRIIGSSSGLLRVSDLSLAEMVKRLGSGDSPAAHLMRGLLAHRDQDDECAVESFNALDMPLGRILVARLDPDSGSGPDPASAGVEPAPAPTAGGTEVVALQRGLLAHLTFDETEGATAHDVTGNGLDFDIMDAAVGEPGRIGTAYVFDGEDDYLRSSVPNMLATPEAITVSCWFKTSSPGGHDLRIFAVEGAYALFYRRHGALKLLYDGSSQGDPEMATGMADGQWHHVVGLNDGAETVLYIDGNRMAGRPETIDDLGQYDRYTTIGGRHTGKGSYFEGTLDDLCIWTRALSAEEIAVLYQWGLEGRTIGSDPSAVQQASRPARPAAPPVRRGARTPEPEAVTEGPDLPWPAGQISGPITTEANAEWSYYLYIPKELSADEKWPVMFVMSPSGGKTTLLKRYIEGAELNQCIVAMSVQSKNNFDGSTKAMMAMVKDVTTRLPVDTRRLYSSGFSGGARMAFTLAKEQGGDDLAGVLACGAGGSTGNSTSDTRIYGLCGSNCFNRWDMACSFKRNQENKAHLKYFVGKHVWAEGDLIAEGMTWLNASTLMDATKDRALLRARADLCRRILAWIDKHGDAHPERAYAYASLVAAMPGMTPEARQGRTLIQKLTTNPRVQTYLKAEADLEKFWREHFCTSAGDYLRKNGTPRASSDAVKFAGRYPGTPYEELFNKLGEKSVVP